MKHLNSAQSVIAVILCVAVSSCVAQKETRYYKSLTKQSSEKNIQKAVTEYFVFNHVLNTNKCWDEFRQKAAFSNRYNEIRIAELKIYLNKYRQVDDSFYKTSLTVLEERNIELKKRIEGFEMKNNQQLFRQRFIKDMEMLVQELKDFSFYNQ